MERPNIVFRIRYDGRSHDAPDAIRSLLHNSSSARLAKSRKEASLRREDSRVHSRLIKCANGTKTQASRHKLTVRGGREVGVQAHFFGPRLFDRSWIVAGGSPHPRRQPFSFTFHIFAHAPRRSFVSYPLPGYRTAHLTTPHVSAPPRCPRRRLYAHADPRAGPSTLR